MSLLTTSNTTVMLSCYQDLSKSPPEKKSSLLASKENIQKVITATKDFFNDLQECDANAIKAAFCSPHLSCAFYQAASEASPDRYYQISFFHDGIEDSERKPAFLYENSEDLYPSCEKNIKILCQETSAFTRTTHSAWAREDLLPNKSDTTPEKNHKNFLVAFFNSNFTQVQGRSYSEGKSLYYKLPIFDI